MNTSEQIVVERYKGPRGPRPSQVGLVLSNEDCLAFDFVRLHAADQQALPAINGHLEVR